MKTLQRECEWCHEEVATSYLRDLESGDPVSLCPDCARDLNYCQRRGKEPLQP